MNIENITKKELEIYSKVCLLKGTIEEKSEQIIKLEIAEEYKEIHQAYANLGGENIEALKRGLFINWFSISEPTFITGIGELDEKAEEKIINEINNHIKKETLDCELEWMLDYYKDWDYAFEKFQKFEKFYSRIQSKEKIEIPQFDREKMENRGQMGKYWNSLNL